MVYNPFPALGRFLFPPTCLLCGRPGFAELDLCNACLGQFPANSHACARCALPLPDTSTPGSLCGECLRHAPPYERLVSPWLYGGKLAELIRVLKFDRRLAAGRTLGLLLARALPDMDEMPQLLLPVPQHPGQLRERGFNHAAEITRQLSRALGIPWSPRLLKKHRATAPQHGLGRRERRRNLRGCFSFPENTGPHRVAVIDDVATTGSTAVEIARTLKGAGVEEVQVWTLARTPLEP